jgi:hypothetical protein
MRSEARGEYIDAGRTDYQMRSEARGEYIDAGRSA